MTILKFQLELIIDQKPLFPYLTHFTRKCIHRLQKYNHVKPIDFILRLKSMVGSQNLIIP